MILHADPVPLRVEEDGAIRVGQSRVLLEIVIGAYRRGQSPEEIARAYDTVELSDVYRVISFYLRHRTEVDDYVRRREEEAEDLRRQITIGMPVRPVWAEERHGGILDIAHFAPADCSGD